MNKQIKIRKPFLCAFMLALIGGSFFCWAYFTKALIFKEIKMEIMGPSTIKIGLFSDLHAIAKKQRNGEIYPDDGSKSFLGEFVAHFKTSLPEFVVVNGDLIEGTRQPAKLGMAELKLVKDSLDELPLEKIWVIGNHDLRSVNREQWKSSLSIDYLDKSFETDDYKIIVLDDNYEMGKNETEGPLNGGVLLSDEQLVWLENELKNSDKIKIVFMHNPPIFGNDISKASYVPKGVRKIQELFADYEVVAVFSGHVERFAHKNIDGVDYYVLPGPTKCLEYSDAFASVRMIDRKAIVTLFSKNESGEYARQKME